nr:FtsK/SpoIIIE domain-containing protein [Morganella morganii]
MAGENITGEPVSLDLTQLPHLLIAGTTGSGKSMLMHSLILSLLYRTSPANVRLVLCDAHHPELSLYHDTPHLLFPVLSDSTKITEALHFLTTEAEIRRKHFSAINAPDLRRYNEKVALAESFGRPIPDPFARPEDYTTEHPCLGHKPAIVICIENAVQLINDHSNIEDLILPLLQQGAMTGIHLLLTTRSPLPTKINQQLKFHIPARIAMTVTSKADSHFIIGQYGAEILSGNGDMLLITADSAEPQRIQGAYISDSDIHNAVDYCKKWGNVSYINTGRTVVPGDDDLDPLFDHAVQFITEKQQVSISGIQQEFRIGYNRAARIVEEMEESGIISEPFSDGRREILVPGIL